MGAPRLLITGSRSWTDRAVIREALREWWESTGRDPNAVLVSGACPKGADRICEELWQHNGLTVERHPAKWRKPNGQRDMGAGYVRNALMVDLGADLCIAFIRNGSRGATHTVNFARKRGMPTRVYEQ